MTRKRIVPLVLAVVAAVALLAGASVVPAGVNPAAAQEATPTPVTTGNIPLVAISPALCFPLVLTAFPTQAEGITHAGNCSQLSSPTNGHAALMDLESIIGNGDGILEPSDFAGIDLDGNQVHQRDDTGSGTSDYDGNLYIIAFVGNTAPVRFRTNLGEIDPAWTDVSDAGPGLAAR